MSVSSKVIIDLIKRILICLFVFELLLICNYVYQNEEIMLKKEIRNSILLNESVIIISDTKVVLHTKNMLSIEISDVTPRQIQIMNPKIYYGYIDKKFIKGCGISNWHRELFDLFKGWIDIAGKNNIPWWINCGTLIGSLRHKDIVPWDHDMDIEIPKQFEAILRNISTKRSEISQDKINIITRPGPHCPYNGMRLNCKGKLVKDFDDGCAFCGPISRIFFKPSRWIDIYLTDIKFDKDQLKFTTESFYDYMKDSPLYPIDWYFPLRNCSLMGFRIKCPRKSEAVLNEHYGSYKPNKKCVNGKWQSI